MKTITSGYTEKLTDPPPFEPVQPAAEQPAVGVG